MENNLYSRGMQNGEHPNNESPAIMPPFMREVGLSVSKVPQGVINPPVKKKDCIEEIENGK